MTNKKLLGARVPTDLADAVMAVAAREGVSLAVLVERILREFLRGKR